MNIMVEQQSTQDTLASFGRHDGPARTPLRGGLPRYFLPAYALLIVYISLSPFSGWQTPERGALHFLVAPWPRYITPFDVIANVLAYMPLGALLWEAMRRHTSTRPALALAVLAGAILSFAMEVLQASLVARIASRVDLIANTAGAFGGAILAAQTNKTWLARLLVRWRHATFNAGAGAEIGELLLAAWLFVQLNPSIPFFAAGTIANPLMFEWYVRAGAAPDHLPNALSVAMNVCGFGLFVSALLKPGVNPVRFAAAVITLGAALKFLAAGVLLKPPMMFDWINFAALAGIALGFVALWIAARLGHRLRIWLAAMLILAGGLIAKLVAIYQALPSTLGIFSWQYGQLLNFTSLTLMLSEVWPLAALVFLLVGFKRLPSSDRRV